MTIRDLANAVRARVTARQVAVALGLEPNREWFCKCPLHGEKTGSMKLYPGNRGWYCFGCHQGGSVLDLVMACLGTDLKGAIEFLNDEFSMGLPVNGKPTREQEEEARRRAAQIEAERKQREARQKKRYEAYLQWLDISREVAQMELDRKEFAPRTMDEEWDERFKAALDRIPQAMDEAADLELMCFGKEEDR